MNDTSPSLELSEVSARFSESEQMLQDTRERLHAILQNERRGHEAAESLGDSARAVAEFTDRADKVLQEAGEAVSVAREILETGRNLISGNAIGVVDKRVETALEEVQKLQGSEAEILAAVNAGSQARERGQERNHQALDELQTRASEIDTRVSSAVEQVRKLQDSEAEILAAINAESQARERGQERNHQALDELQTRASEIDTRVSSALEQVRKLQDSEAEILAAVNAESQARERGHERNHQALDELQTRVSEIDTRVSSALEHVQKLQGSEAEILAAVNAESQARERDQESNHQALAELQMKISEVARGVKSSRTALWIALAALFFGQVVIAVLAVVT